MIINQENRQKIRKEYSEGKSSKELASNNNTSRKTIIRIVKQEGIKPRGKATHGRLKYVIAVTNKHNLSKEICLCRQ